MKNKIFLFLISVLMLVVIGCKTVTYTNQPCSDKQAVSSGFNEENYIWENWIFPSNKTTGK